MANLNVKGSVNITGSLTKACKGPYARTVDVMDQVNDTGWMELTGSPWMQYGDGGTITNSSIRDFNDNYAKFRVVNNICYLAILDTSTTVPVWHEGQTITGLYLGTLPYIITPSSTMSWLANPVDSTGYEVQVGLETNGQLHAVCLGGSRTKSNFRLYTSFPLDVFDYDAILKALSSYY